MLSGNVSLLDRGQVHASKHFQTSLQPSLGLHRSTFAIKSLPSIQSKVLRAFAELVLFTLHKLLELGFTKYHLDNGRRRGRSRKGSCKGRYKGRLSRRKPRSRL
jgi:hypothetical protein